MADVELDDTEIMMVAEALGMSMRVHDKPESAMAAGIVPPCWDPETDLERLEDLKDRIFALMNARMLNRLAKRHPAD